MKKLIIIFTMLFLVFTTCDTTDPKPLEEKPPSYQEDIPWPSLANSPWPMYHNNPQSTGRIDVIGPIIGELNYRIEIPWETENEDDFTSPIIGPDSTIYFIASLTPGNTGSYLYAISFAGKIKWKFPITNDTSSYDYDARKTTTPPFISNENIIYVFARNRFLYAIRNDGILKWKRELETKILGKTTIGKNGNIYGIGINKKLYSFSHTGSQNWNLFIDNGFQGAQFGSISISPDGNTLYAPGDSQSNTLYAVTIEGSVKWRFDNGGYIHHTPLVDSEGNIYIFTQSNTDLDISGLVCLLPTGKIKYIYKELDYYQVYNNLTIDKNGNIYIPAGQIISLDYNGNLRWKKLISSTSYFSSSLMCDGENNIYFASDEAIFFKIDQEGNIIWQYDIGGHCKFPAMGNAGIYFGTFSDGKKYFYNLR